MSLKPNIAHGVAWMVAVRWCIRSLDVITMIVLARLLTPDDFGVFANAVLIIGVLEVVTQAGIDLALIRDRNAGRAHYDAAWTIQILQGVSVFTVLALSATWVAAFFDEPRLTFVVVVLALRPLFASFTNIGVVQFLKELDYRKEFYFGLIKKLAVVSTTLVLAFALRDYMAMVLGQVIGTVIAVACSYFVHAYRPRLCFQKFREIWSYSGWMLLYYGTEDLVEKVDRFVVAATASSARLGNYQMGFLVAYLPAENILVPLWKALTPIYARLRHDSKLLVDTYLDNLGFTTALSMAIGFGTAAIAEDLVLAVFGVKWLDAIFFVQWLALIPAIAGLIDSATMVLSVLGRTRTCAFHSLLRLTVLLLVLPAVGVLLGVAEVAVAACLAAICLLPMPFIFLIRALPITAAQIAARLWRPMLSGAIMFLAIRSIEFENVQYAWIRLVIEILFGAIVYTSLNLLLWLLSGQPSGVERAAVQFLRRRSPMSEA